MTRRLLSASTVALLLSCASGPRPAARPLPEGTIEPAALARHVEVLASDAFEGRKPGTAGEEKTVRYLVEQMAAVGLKPGHQGRWHQEVPLVEVTADPAARLRAMGKGAPVELVSGTDLVLLNPRAAERTLVEGSELVFVGFGIHAPALGRDDYGGVDLTGKTVVMLAGAPPGFGRLPGAAALVSTAARQAEAGRRGAVGVLVVLPPSVDDEAWGHQVARYGGPQVSLVEDTQGALQFQAPVRAPAAERLVAAGGHVLGPLTAAAAKPDFKPVPLGVRASLDFRSEVRPFASRNVIGVLPGAERPDEYVLFLAHWDHLGACAPDASGDGLCNGAVDNASGVGGLLELARAFASAGRPARSVLFLATTAEEHGLLGGKHYARHPAAPLAQTVGGLGLDTIALRGRGADVVVLGHGLSELDGYITRAAQAQGRQVTAVPSMQPFFQRSDHFPLAERGVPVLIATSVFAENAEGAGLGKQLTEEYMQRHYHRPSDNFSPGLRFDGAAQDLELAYRVGRMLADGSEWPTWTPGTPFRAARDASRPAAPAGR